MMEMQTRFKRIPVLFVSFAALIFFMAVRGQGQELGDVQLTIFEGGSQGVTLQGVHVDLITSAGRLSAVTDEKGNVMIPRSAFDVSDPIAVATKPGYAPIVRRIPMLEWQRESQSIVKAFDMCPLGASLVLASTDNVSRTVELRHGATAVIPPYAHTDPQELEIQITHQYLCGESTLLEPGVYPSIRQITVTPVDAVFDKPIEIEIPLPRPFNSTPILARIDPFAEPAPSKEKVPNALEYDAQENKLRISVDRGGLYPVEFEKKSQSTMTSPSGAETAAASSSSNCGGVTWSCSQWSFQPINCGPFVLEGECAFSHEVE